MFLAYFNRNVSNTLTKKNTRQHEIGLFDEINRMVDDQQKKIMLQYKEVGFSLSTVPEHHKNFITPEKGWIVDAFTNIQ